MALITAVCVQCVFSELCSGLFSTCFQWEVWLQPRRWLDQNEHVTRRAGLTGGRRSWLAAGRLSGAEPRCDWWPVLAAEEKGVNVRHESENSNVIPDGNRNNTMVMSGIRWQDATCMRTCLASIFGFTLPKTSPDSMTFTLFSEESSCAVSARLSSDLIKRFL